MKNKFLLALIFFGLFSLTILPARALDLSYSRGRIEGAANVVPAAIPFEKSSKDPLILPILMYHHIRVYKDLKDPVGVNLSVTPRFFARQLDELKRLGFHTITFKDLRAGQLPPKPIILTFDDGYEDNFLYALPELKKRGMRGVVFMISSRVGASGYLSLKELKEMSSGVFEVGSHTVSHFGLAGLPAQKLRKEVVGSKKILEKQLGSPIVSFSYPYGSYSAQAVREVSAAGYDYAVVTRSGFASLNYPLTLYRLRVVEGMNFQDSRLARKKVRLLSRVDER